MKEKIKKEIMDEFKIGYYHPYDFQREQIEEIIEMTFDRTRELTAKEITTKIKKEILKLSFPIQGIRIIEIINKIEKEYTKT